MNQIAQAYHQLKDYENKKLLLKDYENRELANERFINKI